MRDRHAGRLSLGVQLLMEMLSLGLLWCKSRRARPVADSFPSSVWVNVEIDPGREINPPDVVIAVIPAMHLL